MLTPLLVSALVKAGAEVRCVVTRSAAELVSPVALATLSRHPCLQDADQWDAARPRPLHIELAEWSELVIVAPLSASSLARWVHGDGEGLLASLLLACECPVLAAAAMNTAMWQHPAVQRNWLLLQEDPRVLPLQPEVGCWPVIALAPAEWRTQVRLNWLRPVSCCSRMPRHHRQRLARTPCGGECRSNPRRLIAFVWCPTAAVDEWGFCWPRPLAFEVPALIWCMARCRCLFPGWRGCVAIRFSRARRWVIVWISSSPLPMPW